MNECNTKTNVCIIGSNNGGNILVHYGGGKNLMITRYWLIVNFSVKIS